MGIREHYKWLKLKKIVSDWSPSCVLENTISDWNLYKFLNWPTPLSVLENTISDWNQMRVFDTPCKRIVLENTISDWNHQRGVHRQSGRKGIREHYKWLKPIYPFGYTIFPRNVLENTISDWNESNFAEIDLANMY